MNFLDTASGWLNSATSWLGSRPAPPKPDIEPEDRADRTREKARAGPAGIILPNFLPWYDDKTQETSFMRLVYRRMLVCPEVKASALGKILAVAALDLQIHPSDKKDERAKMLADFCRFAFTERMTGGVLDVVWSVLSGRLIDGYSVCEKVKVIEIKGKWAGKLVYRCLKAKDTGNDLVLETDEYKNVVGLLGLRYNAGEHLDPKDFVISSHLPLYAQPTGQSDFRAAYADYWMLDTVMKLRGMGAEKRAMPLLWATYKTASLKPSVEQALERIKLTNWMSAPEEVQVKALEIAGRSDEYFTNFCKDLRERIALAIAGAILQMMQGKEGSQRGSSAVHKDTADLYKWHLSQVIEQVYNDRETGLIVDLIDSNFSGAQEYPHASLSGVDDAELAESLKIDQGLNAMGMDLSKDELRERYGREEPTGPDDVLKGSPPKPADGGGAGHPFGAVPQSEPASGVAGASPFRFSEEWAGYVAEREVQPVATDEWPLGNGAPAGTERRFTL